MDRLDDFIDFGRSSPCILKYKPHALQRTRPLSNRRQIGVVVVLQLPHCKPELGLQFRACAVIGGFIATGAAMGICCSEAIGLGGLRDRRAADEVEVALAAGFDALFCFIGTVASPVSTAPNCTGEKRADSAADFGYTKPEVAALCGR